MTSRKVTYLLYSLSENIPYITTSYTILIPRDQFIRVAPYSLGSTLHGFCIIVIVVDVGASE